MKNKRKYTGRRVRWSEYLWAILYRDKLSDGWEFEGHDVYTNFLRVCPTRKIAREKKKEAEALECYFISNGISRSRSFKIFRYSKDGGVPA